MIESFKLPNITPEAITGSIVSFNDEYGGLPLKSCTSLISGYQEGSGTPSPDNVRTLHAFSSATLTDNGNTYTFTFGQNIYQGYIDWKMGVVVGNWGMVDLGTLDWFPISNAYYADIAGKKNGIGNLICSSYPTYTSTPSLSDMPDKMIKGGSVDNRAYVKDSSYPDASTFKTAMNGVMLAYELATPIEIPLGGINLLTQQGVNNIFADCGDTEVQRLKVN